jgi:2',3'-cyclic-nucleotide 2'-phosphodiesterase (5'-nucleotidase family)
MMTLARLLKHRTAPAGLWIVAALALALSGCAPRGHHALGVDRATGAQYTIDSTLAPAPAVDALIAPYRVQLEAQMGEVLAVSPVEMAVEKPEGLLGALVAGIMLERARRESDLPVEAALTNTGGLRMPIAAGPVTLGTVYEVMPFDNEIVLLRLSAEQMRTLADQIAERGGEPVDGMSFTIRGRAAADLRVGGQPLAERDYWIATNDYLAGGGGGMPVLWEAAEEVRTGVLLRDAIADALRARETLAVPALDHIRRERR